MGYEFSEVVNGTGNVQEDDAEMAEYVSKSRKVPAIVVNALGERPLRAELSCDDSSET